MACHQFALCACAERTTPSIPANLGSSKKCAFCTAIVTAHPPRRFSRRRAVKSVAHPCPDVCKQLKQPRGHDLTVSAIVEISCPIFQYPLQTQQGRLRRPLDTVLGRLSFRTHSLAFKPAGLPLWYTIHGLSKGE